MKPSPRYLAMVLLLAGDSTITSFLPVLALLGTVLLQKKVARADAAHIGLVHHILQNPALSCGKRWLPSRPVLPAVRPVPPASRRRTGARLSGAVCPCRRHRARCGHPESWTTWWRSVRRPRERGRDPQVRSPAAGQRPFPSVRPRWSGVRYSRLLASTTDAAAPRTRRVRAVRPGSWRRPWRGGGRRPVRGRARRTPGWPLPRRELMVKSVPAAFHRRSRASPAVAAGTTMPHFCRARRW